MKDTGTDGPTRGIRMSPFACSDKKILLIKHWVAKIKTELWRVKSLSSTKLNCWVADQREAGILYNNDPTSVLTGVAEKTQDKLREQGIETVGQLKALRIENFDTIRNFSAGRL